jgi:erythromycin esterase
MKYPILICTLFIIRIASAQTQVNIGGATETVYPLDDKGSLTSLQTTALRDLFSSKKIAGFGESTHGTHEFYTTRLQFLELLVTKCGYRTVAFESGYGSCLFVNDYVRDGKGELDTMVKKLEFWNYQNQDVRDLLKWIRSYNTNKKEEEKISFYGFDMQTFYSPIQYLEQEINASSLQNKDEFNRIIQVINDNRSENYKQINQMADKTVPDKLMKAYEDLKVWFSKNEIDMNKVFSKKKTEQLRYCIEDFKMAVLNSKSIFGFRDSCMAVMTEHIQHIENSGIMLYAHMAHLGRVDPSNYFDINTVNKSMGAYLNDKYGTYYFPVGLIFSKGSLTAIEDKKVNNKLVYGGAKVFTLKEDKSHVLSSQLGETGINSFFIPFTKRPHPVFSKIQRTFRIPQDFYERNAMMYSINYTPDVMLDGLIYVKETTGIKLL